ncbi:hypothetical protein ABEF92_001263 [Exophiala dermatitidis]|uniref:Uncharacterized protein n=1 Tax=Exophiala dermatitidis (strain ATCC 34100 / CBS 525.76 / NIH/UT8656) TaxID=858893 RepID=H6BWG5_EXODN|nr:uncharacterized protein HMPREF1120_03356 [Exophiala dermatitidis NIH/UT8656]EHY55211.1 hypothetical protein HMPREF1120_03356 [Exophiala dermatitidis NIH/UT8656]
MANASNSNSNSNSNNNPTLPISLDPDAVEDLIYFSRTGELEGLRDLISALCRSHSCSPAAILASAIDVDADGLGSQSTLLHYPAANGNFEVVEYLISLIQETSSENEVEKQQKEQQQRLTSSSSSSSLINRQNVSGNTPLHWAAINGHLEVVKALVAAGADPSIVNAAGRDAVVESECSANEGAKECANWLLKNCQGLERGVGGGDEAQAADTTMDDVEVENGEAAGEAEDGVERGQGENQTQP